MADIFLSYDSTDRPVAELVAKALEDEGWSAWWDQIIPAGETWADYIKEQLDLARCVVVLWSAHSVESEWVAKEARYAAKKRMLVPALIEDVEPPFEFGEVQAANLVDWRGGDSGSLAHFFDSVERKAPRPQRVADPREKSGSEEIEQSTAEPRHVPPGKREKEELQNLVVKPEGQRPKLSGGLTALSPRSRATLVGAVALAIVLGAAITFSPLVSERGNWWLTGLMGLVAGGYAGAASGSLKRLGWCVAASPVGMPLAYSVDPEPLYAMMYGLLFVPPAVATGMLVLRAFRRGRNT